MPSLHPQIHFLLLPYTARLRIYDYLLVAEGHIIAERAPIRSRISPSILRTCKQIQIEAYWILYRKNTFAFGEPEESLQWFDQVGHVNIGLLKNIRFFISAVYGTKGAIYHLTKEAPFWYRLLDRLAREATRLHHMFIFWDADDDRPRGGAGKDLRFVRELAKIQGLQGLVMQGFYAVHWPTYLAEKMGVWVQERAMTDKSELRNLRIYQEGTEFLIP